MRRSRAAAVSGGGQTHPGGRRAWPLVLAIYLGLALALSMRAWLLNRGAFLGADGDPQLQIWNLGWTPFGLTHGNHRPLNTDYIDYPDQVNMMWQAGVELPGVVLGPVTALFGPLVSYNLLVTLVPALSGFCCYLAVRRYAGVVASAVGGLLYGFSPYVIAQVGGHTHVAIAVFPPLALLALDEIMVRQRQKPLFVGALLGAGAAAQLLTSEEVLATTVLVGALGTALLAALHPRCVVGRLRYALTALGAAAASGLLLAAYPLRTQFFGPAQVHGLLQVKNFYVMDLWGFIVPTDFQLFHTAASASAQASFTGNQAESNAYLGIPLVLLLIAAAMVLRRSAVAVFALALTGLVLLLSLGPQLHIHGRDTGVWLPWKLIGERGVMQNLLPSRLALYAFLTVSVVVALVVDRGLADRRRAFRIAVCGVVALSLLPLLPSRVLVATKPENPSFFTGSAVGRIPEGSVVLVTPFSNDTSQSARAMLWQAESGFRFRMPEGLAFRPAHAVPGTEVTAGPDPSVLQNELVAIQHGGSPSMDAPVLDVIRADLRARHVGTVVVGPGHGEARTLELMRSVLREPAEYVGGVHVFWNVQRAAAA